jgi:hypothetical protein
VFAAEGWLMTAIGWENVLYIWGYALIWLVIDDLVKVKATKLIKLNKMSKA